LLPVPPVPQIFLTFFKTLEGKEVTVELKNDLALRGVLETVDQYLNFKLSNVSVVDQEKFPQLVSAGGWARAVAGRAGRTRRAV
jgi:small nuclear ribonucleoprotein (snRNP)-like protein